MKDKVDLKCAQHQKAINRVTLETFSKKGDRLKTKLLCDNCQDELEFAGLRTIKLKSFIDQYNQWMPKLKQIDFGQLSKFIQAQFDSMIKILQNTKKNLINRACFNSENKQFSQQILNYIFIQQMYRGNSQKTFKLQQMKKAKQAVDQAFKQTVSKFFQSFNQSIEKINNLLKKSFNQIQFQKQSGGQDVNQKLKGTKKVKPNQQFESRKVQKNYQQQKQNRFQTPMDYQDERAQCHKEFNVSSVRNQKNKNQSAPMPNKLRFQGQQSVNKPQDKKMQNESVRVTSAGQPSAADPKSKITPPGSQSLQIEMNVPSDGQFDTKQCHSDIIFLSKTICETKNNDNTLFSLCKPNFSRKYNSRLFKILSCAKYSEIFIGAGFKTNLRRNKHADNYGYHQGVFCIKGSPAISNLFFYSHQYKKQLSLPNYSLQAGYVIEVRVNYINNSFEFSLIKPVFRHLGTMLFKSQPNDQEFTPLVGMKGDVKIRIINKESQQNLEIKGE